MSQADGSYHYSDPLSPLLHYLARKMGVCSAIVGYSDSYEAVVDYVAYPINR